MATLLAEPQSQPPQTKPDSVPQTPPTPPPPHTHTTGQQQQQQPQNQTITAAATAPSGSHQHHRHPDAASFSYYPSSSSPDVPPPPATKTVLELEAANVAHFDALGHNFDEHHPDAAGFADRLSRALRRVLVLDEDATSVLDYACGSGQVSRSLAPYVAQLVGVDISPRMVEVYNARANTQGLEPHEMRAVGSLLELQEQRFDLAVCSMAYHHFASIEDVTRELVAYLKPRGTLAVADILRVEADEGERPIMAKYEYMVAHTRGFAEEEMRGVFEGAGLENVAFERFASGRKEGRDVQFFLATGTKPDFES